MNIAYTEFPETKNIVILRKHLWNSDIDFEIRENGLVDEVIHVNGDLARVGVGKLWQLRMLFFPVHSVKKLINKKILNFEVRAIIAATSIDYIAPLYKCYEKQSPELYFVEEGIGEYTSKNRTFGENSIKKKLKNKIFGREKLRSKAVYRFLLDNMYSNSKLCFVKAPRLSSDPTFGINMRDLFNGDKQVIETTKYNILYFEQPFLSEVRVTESNEFDLYESKIINKLIESSNKTVIKLHPRSKKKYSDDISTIKSIMPWEAMLPSQETCDKLLVSISSTSIVTPKLMMNQEPHVICLLKVFQNELVKVLPNVDQDDINRQLYFFQKVKEMYVNPSRFNIPETLKDAFFLIDEYNNIDKT